MRRPWLLLCGGMLLLALDRGAKPVWAKAEAQITDSGEAPAEEKTRVALLIGNADYRAASLALKNPLHDIAAIGEGLRNRGFEIRELKNATRVQMEEAIRAMPKKAGVIYFSGQTRIIGGQPYLLPIDAVLAQGRAEFRPEQLIAVDQLGADAAAILRSAAPNQLAFEDAGAWRSPFAQALALALEIPNLDLVEVYRRVSVDVVKATDGRQVPTLEVRGEEASRFLFHSIPPQRSLRIVILD